MQIRTYGLRFALGALIVFTLFVGVSVTLGESLLSDLPNWLAAVLVTLGVAAAIAAMGVLFVTQSNRLSRRLKHDNSTVDLRDIPKPGPRRARPTYN